MSDETEGEGSTKFEDIESGGLGDGEGTKDVSEQIESEDQVFVMPYFILNEPCYLNYVLCAEFSIA